LSVMGFGGLGGMQGVQMLLQEVGASVCGVGVAVARLGMWIERVGWLVWSGTADRVWVIGWRIWLVWSMVVSSLAMEWLSCWMVASKWSRVVW